MNKISFFVFLLVISCEEQWTDSESLDFLNRCKIKNAKQLRNKDLVWVRTSMTIVGV